MQLTCQQAGCGCPVQEPAARIREGCFLTGNFSGDIGGSVLPEISVPVDIERVFIGRKGVKKV